MAEIKGNISAGKSIGAGTVFVNGIIKAKIRPEAYTPSHPSGGGSYDDTEIRRMIADRYTKFETDTTFATIDSLNGKQPRDVNIMYGGDYIASEIIDMAMNQGVTVTVVDIEAQEYAIMSRVDLESYKLIFANDLHLYKISLIDNSWEKVDASSELKEEIANLKDRLGNVEDVATDTHINGLIDAKITPLESLADAILEVM